MKNITEIKTRRRYYADKHHAYGWQIGFTAQFNDGSKRAFSSLGTTRANALGHCQ